MKRAKHVSLSSTRAHKARQARIRACLFIVTNRSYQLKTIKKYFHEAFFLSLNKGKIDFEIVHEVYRICVIYVK